jgi:hypothetical protein
MNILSHNLERFVLLKLMLDHRVINLKNLRKFYNLVNFCDFVILEGWKKDSQKAFQYMLDHDIKCFPKADFALHFLDRTNSTKTLDLHTRFSDYKREYYETDFIIPHLGSDKTVIKVGNDHIGKGKYKRNPNLLHRAYNKKCIAEPYIKGRSLRVLIIGDYYLVIEHVNNLNWIKNIEPEEIFPTDYPIEIIEDALNISNKIGSDFIGIDYQIGENLILPLEINIMCGCPDHPVAKEKFIYYYKNKLRMLSFL